MSTVTQENAELQKGWLSPEFIAERMQFYIDRQGKLVLLGCGDDRNVTEESAELLADEYPKYLPPNEGFASVYGAAAGVAKNVIIAGVAQYGPDFIEKIGGFEGAFHIVSMGMTADTSGFGMIPTMHSAEKNEGNATSFNPVSKNDVACAYAMGVGSTSNLLVDPEDSLIRDIARADQNAIFGSGDDKVDKLLFGHKIFLNKGSAGQGKDFVVDRSKYASFTLPIMILAGSHVAATKSGLINSFLIHKVRSSTDANKQGKDFYSQDIAEVTAATLHAFKEFNLDPEILMRAFVLDSTPVRAVLAANDADPTLTGILDPRNLPMGIAGDPKEALAELQTA